MGDGTDNMAALADSMAHHLVKSRRDSTTSKYYGAFRRWEGTFYPARRRDCFTRSGYTCGVIFDKINRYGIKWAHKVRGLNDPTDNNFFTNLFESAKRQNGVQVKKKDIVTSDHIVEVCEKYERSNDILVLRDLAMIILCYAGFLRFDEVSALRGVDIVFKGEYFSHFLVKSKTDQYRQRNEVLISRVTTAA